MITINSASNSKRMKYIPYCKSRNLPRVPIITLTRAAPADAATVNNAADTVAYFGLCLINVACSVGNMAENPIPIITMEIM